MHGARVCETINIGPLVATLTESDIHLRVMFRYNNVQCGSSVRVEGNNVQRVKNFNPLELTAPQRRTKR